MMTPALPALAVLSGEYRALTLFDAVPVDCGSLFVLDDAFAPHLRAGEAAVIDPDDREPANGEIYVVKINSPLAPEGYRLRLVQLRACAVRFGQTDADGDFRPDDADTAAWWMRFGLATPRIEGRRSMEDAMRNPIRHFLSDGPFRTEAMRGRIVGRVVGVVDASAEP